MPFHEYLRYCHDRVTLFSVYQAPSHKSDLTLLAWYSPKLVYLNMLFIREMACTAGGTGQLMNKWHS